MLVDLVKMMPVLCRGVSVCVCACVSVVLAMSEVVLHASGRGREEKK